MIKTIRGPLLWRGSRLSPFLERRTCPGQRPLVQKNHTIRRTLLIGGAFILSFLLLGVFAIQVWEYSNSVEFCANACHDVHPEEVHAFQDSYHANVKCTECHMGRVGTLPAMVLKAGHFRHLPAVIFDLYDRPLESETMRPANESCERCHWPPAFHGDTVRVIRRFQPDKDSTERRTYLILKTGAGEREGGLGHGIHWHISNPAEYIATDQHKQDIRWVRTTLPDGRTVEYNDVTNPLSPQEIASAEKRVMDCVDCHNRMGHPFPSPEQLVDEALSDGRLSQDLPYAKKEMLALLSASYPSQEEALAAVESVEAQYEAAYPEVAASQSAEIQQAAELARELLPQLVFEEPDITWRSFPDNGKHEDFAGCFRCHDGKHLSREGESIRLHCNICHSTPMTVGADDRPPEMPLTTIQEPPSHLETNFMADHRFQANSVCVDCHGEIEFGNDDSSFCANSACHGRAWPLVELDAAFPHPIELEGKHAEAWCHNCHDGVQKPAYECANCHEPPTPPHYGPTCEDCHTTDGFEATNLARFQHPVRLEGEHAPLDCVACHAPGESPTNECTACHQPSEDHPPGMCETCHTPVGWVGSPPYIVARAPRIPHDLYLRENCLLCHDLSSDVWPAPANHIDRTNEQCSLCHKAGP